MLVWSASGVVAPFDYLFKCRKEYPITYEEEVDRCPAVKDRVSRTKRVTGYFATKDYSYRSKQAAGNGWVLIGDAFGFLDPLYSPGVLLALKSGELAADAIVEGLAKRDTSVSPARQMEQRLQRRHGSHATPGVNTTAASVSVISKLPTFTGNSDGRLDWRPLYGSRG